MTSYSFRLVIVWVSYPEMLIWEFTSFQDDNEIFVGTVKNYSSSSFSLN